ncbi:predicted protein [Nematostella vectensis]|uniref:THAP-type domain-containing protein n=1 Tax=Nematostella vectensis TaxID=45351 RepID=A7T6Q1_NEMVE|nr:predicted protein [Nematostella vectensis]|eukprot:XP_001620453.1 hypothetical protein NEMVEDRAFT_v1g223094 [Nematostella vectensis]
MESLVGLLIATLLIYIANGASIYEDEVDWNAYEVTYPRRADSLSADGGDAELSTRTKIGHEEQASYVVDAFGKTHHIDLKKNRDLVSLSFTLRYFKKDGTEVLKQAYQIMLAAKIRLITDNISMHNFPKDRKLRHEWEKFVRTHRPDFRARGDNISCSDHFKKECYNGPKLNVGNLKFNRRLIPGSIPTEEGDAMVITFIMNRKPPFPHVPSVDVPEDIRAAVQEEATAAPKARKREPRCTKCNAPMKGHNGIQILFC